MKVLITGITGFVMASVARYFARQGYEVTGIDTRLPEEVTRKFWGDLKGGIRVILGDVVRWNTFTDLRTEGPYDVIIHGAAVTPDPAEELGEKASRIVEINITGTINALRFAAEQKDFQKFVYISSTNVYQPAPELLTEDSRLSPVSLYGVTKLACEHIVRRYHEVYHFPVVSVRVTSVYGAAEYATPTRQNPSFMYQCCQKALGGVPVRLKDPDMLADWVYAEDVAGGIFTLVNTPGHPRLVYNLSNGIPTRAVDVLKLLASHLPGLHWEVVNDGSQNVVYPSGSRHAVSSRIMQDAGFKFQYNLESGIKHYLEEMTSLYGS